MENNKQVQKAGDNSTQIQTTNLVINNGIEEKRAREIFVEMFDIARKDLTQEAIQVANQRVSEFENELIPKMKQIDGALNSFADPSFQFLLTNAHKTAASTDRKSDYELLSELLLHRIEKRDDKKTIAGINRAVKIVDEISDPALLALTMVYCIQNFRPKQSNVFDGLDEMNSFLGLMCYDDLPSDSQWLDHLDILDAIRIYQYGLGKMNEFEEIYCKMMSGYCALGIKIESENYNKACELLSGANLSMEILGPNCFNVDYVRLSVVCKDDIDEIKFYTPNGNELSNEVSNNKRDVLRQIYDLYDNDSALNQEIKNKFISEILKRDNLRKVRDWWNRIPIIFQITSVGNVLAYSNASRLYTKLPELY